MTPRISLRGVKVLRGCGKPNCQTGSHSLNRHHKKHEAMWLGIWASRRRGEPEWHDFVTRYHEFHEDDICHVCVSHHAEIHVIYDQIIKQDIALRAKPLSKYMWSDAKELMDKLEKACLKWMKAETPGISSELYGSYRDRERRKKLKRRPKSR
jgi:hypothetical protein